MRSLLLRATLLGALLGAAAGAAACSGDASTSPEGEHDAAASPADGAAVGNDAAAATGGEAGTDAAPADAGSESVTIDFDDLPSHAIVTNQYAARARFSSDTGHFVTLRLDGITGTSAPNYACASDTAGVCGHQFPTYVDFTKPVRGITFHAVGVGSSTKFGQVKVTHDGAVSTVDMLPSKTESWVVIDLSQFSGVTRIEISDTDGAGIGLDDFKFIVAL
jgi:hypothetical protein